MSWYEHQYKLRLALQEKNTVAARAIINSPGFDPNLSIESMIIKFPLVLAAEMGNETIVRLLIEKGADLMTQGTRALIGAIDSNHVNIVRTLLAYPDINVNALQMFPRYNSLHRAIINHANIEIIKLLLAHGADINMKDGVSGATPLMIALHDTGFYPEYTNQLLDVLLQNTTLDINESVNGQNALQRMEYQYRTCNPLLRNNYLQVINKLLAHGAVHPDANTQIRMLRDMGASRFLQNRKNATWKRRRSAVTSWHGAREREFENESAAPAAVPAPAAQVNNNGSTSVEAALKAFRNLGYRVGKNTRKTMRRRHRK